MDQNIVQESILFSVTDVFRNTVRTTKEYWQKIKTSKHQELTLDYPDCIKALETPDEVYQSVQDPYISLFYKRVNDKTLVVVVKYLNDDGFVVTAYQTSKTKRKGKRLWPTAIK